jgi:hypothetical protein
MAIDWSKAPDEAEFHAGFGFWKYLRGELFLWSDHGHGYKSWGAAGGADEYETLRSLSDYCERPQQWPETDERIDVIGSNGNTAEHYAQAKHDSDKPRYDLLPPVAIDLMAQVMTFGAKKYKPEGWRTVPDAVQRYQAALLRHSFAMLRGEVLDPESGLPHAAHAMCCAAFLAELYSSDHGA